MAKGQGLSAVAQICPVRDCRAGVYRYRCAAAGAPRPAGCGRDAKAARLEQHALAGHGLLGARHAVAPAVRHPLFGGGNGHCAVASLSGGPDRGRRGRIFRRQGRFHHHARVRYFHDHSFHRAGRVFCGRAGCGYNQCGIGHGVVAVAVVCAHCAQRGAVGARARVCAGGPRIGHAANAGAHQTHSAGRVCPAHRAGHHGYWQHHDPRGGPVLSGLGHCAAHARMGRDDQ